MKSDPKEAVSVYLQVLVLTIIVGFVAWRQQNPKRQNNKAFSDPCPLCGRKRQIGMSTCSDPHCLKNGRAPAAPSPPRCNYSGEYPLLSTASARTK
jgi:hypothetical protein